MSIKQTCLFNKIENEDIFNEKSIKYFVYLFTYKYIIHFINVEIINDIRNIDERSRKKEKEKSFMTIDTLIFCISTVKSWHYLRYKCDVSLFGCY